MSNIIPLWWFYYCWDCQTSQHVPKCDTLWCCQKGNKVCGKVNSSCVQNLQAHVEVDSRNSSCLFLCLWGALRTKDKYLCMRLCHIFGAPDKMSVIGKYLLILSDVVCDGVNTRASTTHNQTVAINNTGQSTHYFTGSFLHNVNLKYLSWLQGTRFLFYLFLCFVWVWELYQDGYQ